MSAEKQNPIGIVDPDGRIWPFNNEFSPQMRAAGCEAIYDRREYAKRLKAQLVEDERLEREKREQAEFIRDSIFEEEGLYEEYEPVDVKEAAGDLGVSETPGKGKKKAAPKKQNKKPSKTAKESFDALLGGGEE